MQPRLSGEAPPDHPFVPSTSLDLNHKTPNGKQEGVKVEEQIYNTIGMQSLEEPQKDLVRPLSKVGLVRPCNIQTLKPSSLSMKTQKALCNEKLLTLQFSLLTVL